MISKEEFCNCDQLGDDTKVNAKFIMESLYWAYDIFQKARKQPKRPEEHIDTYGQAISALVVIRNQIIAIGERERHRKPTIRMSDILQIAVKSIDVTDVVSIHLQDGSVLDIHTSGEDDKELTYVDKNGKKFDVDLEETA